MGSSVAPPSRRPTAAWVTRSAPSLTRPALSFRKPAAPRLQRTTPTPTPTQQPIKKTASKRPTKTVGSRADLPRFSFPGFRRKSNTTQPTEVRPVLFKPTPKPKPPVIQDQKKAEMRRKLAFMPNSKAGRRANPWAPYQSRADYERAVARTQWQPREPLAQKRNQRQTFKPTRRFSFSSLFKPFRAKEESTSSQRKTISRAPRSQRIPNSHYVTKGLPQQDQSSGLMIETTLFGR